jgi:hypothetical protein
MLMMMPSIWHNSRNAGLIENSSDWLGLAAATATAAAADDDDDDENNHDALILERDSITYRFVIDIAAADDDGADDDGDDEEDDDKELDATTGGSSKSLNCKAIATASAAAELYSLVSIFDFVADDESKEEEEDPISSLVSIVQKFDKCGLFKEREAITPTSSFSSMTLPPAPMRLLLQFLHDCLLPILLLLPHHHHLLYLDSISNAAFSCLLLSARNGKQMPS